MQAKSVIITLSLEDEGNASYVRCKTDLGIDRFKARRSSWLEGKWFLNVLGNEWRNGLCTIRYAPRTLCARLHAVTTNRAIQKFVDHLYPYQGYRASHYLFYTVLYLITGMVNSSRLSPISSTPSI